MATNIVAGMTADGGDPRLPGYDDITNVIAPRMRRLHDPNVTLEEYEYYARKTREVEDADTSTAAANGILSVLWPKKAGDTTQVTEIIDEKTGEKQIIYAEGEAPAVNISKKDNRLEITDEEWINANRALRTASAGAVFYLITTDVLGPFGIGFSIGLLGWGPGIALFTVFGALAAYSGYLLWNTFLALDSHEYPCKNYADLMFRTWGSIPRHVVNTLQSIQLLLSVGILVLNMGMNLSQVSKFRLCYAVCCLIWAIVGFGVGQVRTLQKFGWLANFAIFINLMIMFITMGVIAHSPPNYEIQGFGSVAVALDKPELVMPDAAGNYPPVQHSAGMPESNNGFVGAVTGLMQGVYAYAGLQLYVEFMGEMKRPRDFIKAMVCAQTFIYIVYMVYGSYVYYFQGQYTYQNSYQGVSPYGWQVVGDMLFIIAGTIAAALYGNIGIKVIYNNVLMEFFNAPPLTVKSGKILWVAIVPVYWSIAFIIAAAIPDFFGLTAIVAASCFVQFTYTFPPFIALGHAIQSRAIRRDQGEGFDPVTGQVTRHDSGMTRFVRGFFAGKWYNNIWLIIYTLGALVVSGLGCYSSIESLIDAFKNPQINSFTCQSPLDPANLS